ncbi:TrbI/VirB10 family protein [Telmatospirillum sp.]|uniref:TrbI/VirB10 family protein n=1 Tax=Telmatospirillum sp. TaxID=2079197 RepID=UPI00284DD2EC|nr:TrbI/VirB10 family protein [Telmatospirillum sp.]MDR3440111.1 TrbI/VirB10 family protein [Telmatospirillum sp.]
MAVRARPWICASLALLVVFLAACDNPPPARPEKKLPIPKGESTLDDLIKRSQAKPVAPPEPARLVVEPNSTAFPSLFVGETASRQIQLSNAGGEAANLLQIHVAGQPQAFLVGGSCVSGLELRGQSGCTVTVTFRPQHEGGVDGELVIAHTAAGGPLFVSLTGTAKARQAVAAAVPVAANAQASLEFARSRQDGGLSVETETAVAADRRPGSDTDYSEAGLKGIVSTFPVDRTLVITADRYIPAVLENTINSQLPGRAIAVVERNVYGEQGRTVLIPAGSRVIGQYRSLGRYGEARLDINWTRILRPDGVNINIDDRGADVMGRAGLPGDLDTRFFEKYGSSLMTSAIAAAGEWALNGNSTAVTSPLGGTSQTLSGRARAANRMGNDLDQLGQRMVQENVDIRPVLTVPQGTRLDIIPNEDIWLRDPNRLQAVTPPKGGMVKAAMSNNDLLMQMAPGLVDMVAQNPGLQRVAPQTAQQIMQSYVLQQLRENGGAQSSYSGNANGPATGNTGGTTGVAGGSATAGRQ